MKDYLTPSSPLPVLNSARLDQMIETALNMPQDKKKTGLWVALHYFLRGVFVPGNNVRAGFAVVATIMIVSVVTLSMPMSLSPLNTDMDNTLSELHDMLIYDTIDAAI